MSGTEFDPIAFDDDDDENDNDDEHDASNRDEDYYVSFVDPDSLCRSVRARRIVTNCSVCRAAAERSVEVRGRKRECVAHATTHGRKKDERTEPARIYNARACASIQITRRMCACES